MLENSTAKNDWIPVQTVKIREKNVICSAGSRRRDGEQESKVLPRAQTSRRSGGGLVACLAVDLISCAPKKRGWAQPTGLIRCQENGYWHCIDSSDTTVAG